MDVLAWIGIGRFLRWRHARTALQLPLFLVAALIIFDGLAGPQLAPKNLATVGVWLHYRGLVVLALLLAGNLFCLACPFMLPRQAARWLRERFWGGLAVPRWLRAKWLAVGLVVLFFFAYEAFDLWATPWWTAWLAVAYFAAACAVDAVFRGAAFCKYVCPLGQFNFFGSLISPLEIRVRVPATCAACRTKDCITAGQTMRRSTLSAARRTNPAVSQHPLPVPGGVERSGHDSVPSPDPSTTPREPTRDAAQGAPALPGARGCELWLFQERKVGNMDCTFCLDCVHACPYDNVGLMARAPTAELWVDPFRSGIGRFSQRADLAVLVSILIFGAYLNAFTMIRPVYALQAGLARWLGTASDLPGLALIFVIGLVVVPGILLSLAGLVTRALGGLGDVPIRSVVTRYVYALVPMGFGMWLAHYAFHFLTGALTIVPVLQSFLVDVGLYSAQPAWGLGPLVPTSWLFPIEAALLYLGAFGSIIVAFRIAHHGFGAGHEGQPDRLPRRRRRTPKDVLAAAAPWMLLTLLLLGFGLWILLQPMEMRGTIQMLSGS